MAGNVVELTDAEFDATINDSKPVLVDFGLLVRPLQDARAGHRTDCR